MPSSNGSRQKKVAAGDSQDSEMAAKLRDQADEIKRKIQELIG
jgi:hypothetical protein